MKFLIVAQFICVINICVAQISPFTFESYKDYNNGKRIAYFSIEGIKDLKEQNLIRRYLLEDSNIFRLNIQFEDNQYRCMIETTPDFDEVKIRNLINEFIYKRNIYLIRKKKATETSIQR